MASSIKRQLGVSLQVPGRAVAVSPALVASGLSALGPVIAAKDFARLVGFSVRTLAREVSRGVLAAPIVKENRRYWTMSDLEAYQGYLLSKRGKGTMSPPRIVHPAVGRAGVDHA